MKKKQNKKWFSMLLAASMVLGSITIPSASATAAPMEVRTAEVTDQNVMDTAMEDAGRIVNFNKNWKFHYGNVSNADQTNFDDSAWDTVSVPHDFSIFQDFDYRLEAESGFLPGGIGWYRKSMTFPADYADKTVVMNFDGAYNHTYLYVNGQKIGENHYGYNNFAFDISQYLTCDGSTENVISVMVENKFPSSRWYSGSGLYRDVTLVVSDKLHVAQDSVYVTTPNLKTQKDGDVSVNVSGRIKNDNASSKTASVRVSVLDEQGNVVSAQNQNVANVTVTAGTEGSFTQVVKVNQPKLWSCEEPNLYYVKTEVLEGSEVVDTTVTEYGFRYFTYTPNGGFVLNDKPVKMKGVCMHHDLGALGSASYYDAVLRQVEILKGMGCNAIRSSHNTPSDMLIKICNKEGILVMDEIFDGWPAKKNGNTHDFSEYFEVAIDSSNQIMGKKPNMTWGQLALENNINRDKNAPSVVMWSIGNELGTGGTDYVADSKYLQVARNLIEWINAIDPTKPITHGDNSRATGVKGQIDQLQVDAGGIAGMNYYPTNWEKTHRDHPAWPMVGTETASPGNSRGIYYTLGESSKLGDYQCTAYDTCAVGWGNTARESWYYTVKNDFMSGEFIWTGFDYIGEPTGAGSWNGVGGGSVVGGQQAVPNSSYFGVIDTAGFPKDSYYYYASQWLDDGTTTLHVVPQSWNKEDLTQQGGKVPVHIYSNAAKVELYLNDQLIGTSTRNVTTTAMGHQYATYTNKSEDTNICTAVSDNEWKSMAAMYQVKHENGTLSTKAYDEAGNEITDTYGLSSVTTNTDNGTKLKLETEKTELQADGSSLSFISVDVVDQNDQFVSAARNHINFTLTGNGTIVGVDNGNPSTVDKFQQKSVLTGDTTANIDAFSGKALIIVRSTEEAGGFSLTAQSAGLERAVMHVNTVGETQGEVYIKDYEMKSEYTVKMGETPALEEKAVMIMSDGSRKDADIKWDEIPETTIETPGEYTVKGVMQSDAGEMEVEAFLHVEPVFIGVDNYSRAVGTDTIPALPKTLAGILKNGESYGSYPVVWDEMTQDMFAEVGTIVTVQGEVTLPDGTKVPVTANVRVAAGQELQPVNIAPDYAELVESCGTPADTLTSITNGTKNVLNSTAERWTNWNDHLLSSTPSITFTWDEAHKIDTVKLWFFIDGSVSVPEKVTISVAEDQAGIDFREVTYTAGAYQGNAENVFTFDSVKNAKAVKIAMKQQGNGYVGLTEAEIWTTSMGYEVNDTAELEDLKVDGETVAGFEEGKVAEYAATVANIRDTKIEAAAKDNAAVTITNADDQGVVRIIVRSEDQKTVNVHKIKFTETNPLATEAQKEELAAAVKEESKFNAKDYTADSYSKYQRALSVVKALADDPNATEAEAEKVLEDLKQAIADLKKITVPTDPTQPGDPTKPGDPTQPGDSTKPGNPTQPGDSTQPTPTPENPVMGVKVGSTIVVKKVIYKVIKAGEVTLVKATTGSKFTVPATIKSGNTTLKVTQISKNAFKNNKKLKKVTIGKNVTVIGANAFAGCKKLKTIIIKTSKLKKVKSKAFKDIHAKATIKVPKKKFNAYKKLLKNKGQKKTVKIKK